MICKIYRKNEIIGFRSFQYLPELIDPYIHLITDHIHDHFLDLGSNSLRAMQVHARLLSQLPNELPAHLIFACTTVAEMALLITQQRAPQADQAELVQLLAMLEATSPEEIQIIG